VVIDGLNQPTSLEFIGDIAYVVMLGSEIWKIADVGRPRYGTAQYARRPCRGRGHQVVIS
jgi:hypothetical protein